MAKGTVEDTLHALLDAEADEMCKAQRYERSPERIETRARHYKRKLHTKAGEIEIKMPKLRKQTFETAIIERYRRRDISIEEAIVPSRPALFLMCFVYSKPNRKKPLSSRIAGYIDS